MFPVRCGSLVALLVFLAGCSVEQPAAPSPPHVVLILADDLGIGDLGSYNSGSKVPTPNLDRLAANGMRFTDAHSPSAVCTPTRYGLLTGRYSWRTRLKSGVVWGEDVNLIDVDRMTIADMLRGAGYATAAFGKWHLGLGAPQEGLTPEESKTDWSGPLVPGPLEHGFDEFFGIPASLDMEPHVYVRDRRVEAQATERIEASAQARVGGGGFWRAGPIAPGFRHIEVLPRVVDEAASYLERRAQARGAGDARPFILYVPLPAPHKPWMPTEPFLGSSEAGPYGDFVAMVDHETGRILTALDEHGFAEDTIVIFASDNGAQWIPTDIDRYDHLANADWRGQKADIYEGGHRVPMLVRWRGRVAAGTVSDALLCLTDVQATLAGILDVELSPDAAEDSFDQSAIWLGESDSPPRTAIVHHSSMGLFSIREQNWKLILGLGSGGFTEPRTVEAAPGGPAGQLFDLAADPGEKRDLYAENPEKVEELTSLLERYRQRGRSRD